ncbi:alpha-glucosidase C-terminal domain-containing protein [Clostridium sp. PL3]|uniref:Alpha-glucosidase C-terminal domain-containing protein n=1 Tax=Clostridium thailandense TaxID=2794346 RepID=A0A949TVN1_9CLOT|nr:alpha-amylase family glycosyl hydrolase [Clostridium thailandense]MBV7276177.1 alpha-glucosidase C-terminal domain-containing protein [Clostridium thailandense]
MMSWIEDSVFYHIYPLGFSGAPHENKLEHEKVDRLKKIEEWIPHMRCIGVNALYLGPLFESDTHGYDTRDYYKVDRRLGSNDDLKRICKSLHESGVKIVLDGVFNHVGRGFWAFKDVLENGRSSKYCSWFSNINFNARSPYGDDFSYDSWEGHYNLVKLNLKDPEVKNHIFKAVEFWIENFDVDGLRLDAANCIDFEFLRELSAFCKNKKPDFWLMGEVIHGDYNRWANENMLDSITNYECYKGIYSSHNDKNYFEIAYSLNRQFGDYGIYKNIYLYNFVDNHDVSRIASILKKPQYIYNVYTLLFTMPGVPSIYYGSEWGITGEKEKSSDYSLRPELNLNIMVNYDPNKEILELICKLTEIRKNSKALKKGNYKQILVRNEQFVFSRTLDDETVIVALNLSDKQSIVEISIPSQAKYITNLLNKEKYQISNGKINLILKPFSSKIMM